MAKTFINPLTGRRIAIGKATYKKVMKLKDNVEELKKIANKQARHIHKKNKKAKEFLLKLDIAELQKDIKKHI